MFMHKGVLCAVMVIALVCSPVCAWGASVQVDTHMVCPLCLTDNDLTSWDGTHEYHCTVCGLPLRQPVRKTLTERWFSRFASLRPNGNAMQGSLMVEGAQYRERGGIAQRATEGAATLRLQWKRMLGNANAFVDAYAIGDTLEERTGGEQMPSRHAPIIGVREAFVDATFFGVDCRFGKQLWSWGKGDLVHLVDVLNPEDRTNLFHEERLGVWGSTFSRRFGETDIDVVAVPRLSPTLLPSASSRFFIAPFNLERVSFDGLREGVAVRMVRTDFDIDWSLIAVRGSELTPSAMFTSPFVPPTLVYPERTLVGATGETVLGDYGVRGEVAYTMPADAITDQRMNVVLGVDRVWQDVFAPLDQLYLNVEATVERILREGNGIEFPRPFTQTVAMKAEYTHERWVPSLTLVHSFGREGILPLLEGGDSYVEARVRFDRTDHDEIEVRADVPMGADASFFGSQKGNANLSVLWRVRF